MDRDDGGNHLYQRMRSEDAKQGILDIGHDVRIMFTTRQGSEVRTGLVESHKMPDGPECGGSVTFDVPAAEGLSGPRWQLISMDPLHIEPSILCRRCGHHGWIRDGRWVPA